MLRIIVIGLVLINILIIAAKMMLPTEERQAIEITRNATSRVPSIRLLSKDSSTQTANPGLPNQPETAEDIASSYSCIRLGPFESEADLALVESELQNQFQRLYSWETKSIVDNGYWVFVPPHSSRGEAEQTIAQLTAAGASEFYIVPGGNTANAISLGVYQRRVRAGERRDQLQSLGLTLDIEIAQQTAIKSSYWLETGPVDALNPVLLPIAYSYPDAEQLQTLCSEGAFETQVLVNKNSQSQQEYSEDSNISDN